MNKIYLDAALAGYAVYRIRHNPKRAWKLAYGFVRTIKSTPGTLQPQATTF